MPKVTITDGEKTFDVEFAEKSVYIMRHNDPDRIILAEIGLASAAGALVDQFLYEEP